MNTFFFTQMDGSDEQADGQAELFYTKTMKTVTELAIEHCRNLSSRDGCKIIACTHLGEISNNVQRWTCSVTFCIVRNLTVCLCPLTVPHRSHFCRKSSQLFSSCVNSRSSYLIHVCAVFVCLFFQSWQSLLFQFVVLLMLSLCISVSLQCSRLQHLPHTPHSFTDVVT